MTSSRSISAVRAGRDLADLIDATAAVCPIRSVAQSQSIRRAWWSWNELGGTRSADRSAALRAPITMLDGPLKSGLSVRGADASLAR